MTERPILFSGAMVRAILDGRKTQTRRICKGARELSRAADWPLDKSPYGQAGHRLWVRETWMDLTGTGIEPVTGNPGRYAFAADTPPGSYGDERRKDYGLKWRPSIFMPREASRITLEITGVRVERLQEISESDAEAEGARFGYGELFDPTNTISDRRRYELLWDQINAKRAPWASNPFVWAIEFKRTNG